ncbi:MAG: ATP-binding protein [Ectothiorhodospiraceae bacterium AqS1]|nr:ATP-binding protein [Ectothiorhodospiraceae bacterium AqS1]
MTVDLNVLDHLGVNLYSNIAAVLTEAVANAWDADAENVEIRLDLNVEWIEIIDDGIGMTVSDMNEKYLRVGYRRREEDTEHGRYTAKGRQVMGRKGLGKLSLFSIANIIDVQSAKDGEAHGLRMSVEGIRNSVKNNKKSYSPDPLSNNEIDITKGTKIVLKDIKRQRLGHGATTFRKRLARRFYVIGKRHNFKIAIDGQPIITADRGDLSISQFLWTFGEFKYNSSTVPNMLEQESLSHRIDSWPDGWNISRWIGTVRLPKRLDSKDAGSINGIVSFARGRLFRENILDKVNDSRLYTKYLTGQVEVDIIDDDDQVDIATRRGQCMQKDYKRYASLLSFLQSTFTKIERSWTEWRRKHEVKKAKETFPILDEWLKTFPRKFG